ncbi:GNAT family N-acetyltransferase [Ornithinibacillus californiensis]|uniref:GNAT family N-acetyltransferase n=1 Tax=Ornithinibacillus californiensis TaxID=161536 RepID=UPI00064E0BC0|nr:GNAT family N-acetyltransferase [Ornithinibacillus californiensis]
MKVYQTTDAELITNLNKDVHDLHVNLYPEYFKPYNSEEIQSFFQGLVDKAEYVFLVLEDADIPLGFAMLEIRAYPETIFKKSYQSVYVHQLGVNATKRGKGYGSFLMKEIEKLAKEHEIHQIELDYWSNNEEAKNFYKKNDYDIHREFVFKRV